MININQNNRKWWIFFGMAAALSVVFLDQTAISVALPAIQKSFNMTNVTLQWVINAYLVSIAAIVIFGGKLGDVLGHKNIFLVGIVIFVLSSILCASAGSSTWLITSRVIQGIGGAFMIPVTGVMIAHAFAENERGKAMGLYISVASVFLSLGPLLSGILVHYLNWRWVFWINVPISIISIILTVIAVPRNENRQQSFKPLDWLGFITFSTFITALVIALMEGVNLGWDSTEIIFLFIISAFFAILFVIVENKAADPMIRLALFKQKTFLAANIALLFFTFAFTSSVFWAILLQNVMGYSAISTGLFYLPVTIPVMFMAPIGGKLRDKFGPRFPALLGSTLVAIGSFWIAISVFKGNYFAMLPGFILFGLGPSLIYSALMATTISSVPLSQIGMASGINNGIRQVGRVLGVAMIGSVISNIEHYKITHSVSDLSDKLKHLSNQQIINLISNTTTTQNILGLPSSAMEHMSILLKSIFTFAFSMSMVFTGVLVIFALITSFLLPSKPLRRLSIPVNK